MKRSRFVIEILAVALLSASARGADQTGRVEFKPTPDEASVAGPFRMARHAFDFNMIRENTVSRTMDIWRVTFPSPVVTPHPNNNTVHCEYFRPRGDGPFPGVVVLHILGGDFDLARLFARHMASAGVAALFVKMPYYGPRRQPDAKARMVSIDPRDTVAGMRQAVLDVRRAAAFLAAREEIDAGSLGIFGISLGGITSALAATAEPRFAKVGLMLAGGGIGQVAWNAPELAPLRRYWLAKGETKESFFATLQTVDPVTYADNLRGKKLLMINGRHDRVIPRECAESLWRAAGEPEIVWLDAGHYTAARYLFLGLARVTQFFQPVAPAAGVE